MSRNKKLLITKIKVILQEILSINTITTIETIEKYKIINPYVKLIAFCFSLPTTSSGADRISVWKVGASADTSHRKRPAIAGVASCSTTRLAPDRDIWLFITLMFYMSYFITLQIYLNYVYINGCKIYY